MHTSSIILIIIVLLLGIYFFLICPDLSRQKRMEAFHNIMFAHRGLHYKSRGIPENSMAAFRGAIDKNYGIELDLHISADGELVVFHDDTLERMCGRGDRPEALTAKELTQIRLLDSEEHIPLFQDVLSLVDGKVPLLVELKMPTDSQEICEKTYEMLKHYHGPYLIQSFNTHGLHWFMKHAPEVLRGQLSSRLTKTNPETHLFLRFITEQLLVNFYGRPDFISYKLADLPLLSATILRKLFGTTFAVWTLRSEKAIQKGRDYYEIQIFEDPVNFINK